LRVFPASGSFSISLSIRYIEATKLISQKMDGGFRLATFPGSEGSQFDDVALGKGKWLRPMICRLNRNLKPHAFLSKSRILSGLYRV